MTLSEAVMEVVGEATVEAAVAVMAVDIPALALATLSVVAAMEAAVTVVAATEATSEVTATPTPSVRATAEGHTRNESSSIWIAKYYKPTKSLSSDAYLILKLYSKIVQVVNNISYC